MESPTTEIMVDRISTLPDKLGANSCFGEPVERDGHTLIPVARVSLGFGVGFGRGAGTDSPSSAFSENGAGGGEGEGGGGGGGGSASPVAVIDISRDEVSIRPIEDPTRVALSGIALAGWLAFWVLMTMRTFSRESTRRRKLELKHVEG
ncbi:MAG: spore germination protein GerW family protein [Dehalococcoidia bacterium]